MDIWAAKVEGPVSMMTIGALEVRVCRRMRLHIYPSLNTQNGSYVDKRMYNSWVGVPRPAAEVCYSWNIVRWQAGWNEMWLVLYVSTETKGRRRALG